MADLNLCVQKGVLTNFADDTQLTTVEDSVEDSEEEAIKKYKGRN